MKTIMQSLLFILVVASIAIAADELNITQRPDTMQESKSANLSISDQEFITSMIEHHDGAIIMAKEVLVKSNRPELKEFAQKIITAQSTEIEQMYDWRKNWFNENSHIEMRMGESMPSMAVDLGTSDTEFDRRFLTAMIKHHEGAVSMAKKVLLPTDRQEIHDLAKNIITNQTAEIKTMQEWLKEWYAQQ